MKQFILLLITMFFIFSCNNINKENLCLNTKKSTLELTADSLKQAGKLNEAIPIYKEIYNVTPNEKTAYSLAYSYSLYGELDSSLIYLHKATKCDSSIYRIFNPNLYPLINNKEWISIKERQIDKIEIKYGKYGNRDLVNRLMLIQMKDQAYYWHAFSQPENAEIYWKKKIELNEENEIEAKQIIKEYGWPTRELVGIDASGSLFLVLQHSNLSLMKTFQPELKKMTESDTLFLPQYALLDDRINKAEGRKQLYGSQPSYDSIKQVYYLDNVVSPDSLDIRRKKMGLNPIKEYLEQWDAELRIYE